MKDFFLQTTELLNQRIDALEVVISLAAFIISFLLIYIGFIKKEISNLFGNLLFVLFIAWIIGPIALYFLKICIVPLYILFICVVVISLWILDKGLGK